MRKLLATFAVVGTVGLAACQSDREPAVIDEEPVIEEPAPAPAVTEPTTPPMPDTGADSMMMDTSATMTPADSI